MTTVLAPATFESSVAAFKHFHFNRRWRSGMRVQTFNSRELEVHDAWALEQAEKLLARADDHAKPLCEVATYLSYRDGETALSLIRQSGERRLSTKQLVLVAQLTVKGLKAKSEAN